jgi:predicted HicB family RNase H-like nuclease
MEKTMAATKEQMNVQIPSDLKDLAKMCAAAQHKSLNLWIENAIQEVTEH